MLLLEGDRHRFLNRTLPGLLIPNHPQLLGAEGATFDLQGVRGIGHFRAFNLFWLVFTFPIFIKPAENIGYLA